MAEVAALNPNSGSGQGDPAPEPSHVAPHELTLREKLERAIGQLVVLRATTVVGAVVAIGADEMNRVTGLRLDDTNQQVASTSFNMLLGDGSVITAPIFVTDPSYKALHEQTVKEAREIREQSVQLLQEMWVQFASLLDKRLDSKPGNP